MKHIASLLLLAAGLMAFTSCDKIDEDKYLIFAGASGTWYESTADIPHVQRAFVEKYTGVRCINCPKADETIHAAAERYGDALVTVAVHARSNGFGRPLSGDPSLCTEDGDTWYDYFGINAQPAAMINRARTGNAWDIFTPTSNFDDRINSVIRNTPPIAIMVQNTMTEESDALNSDVHIEFLENFTEELTLTVLVTEDKIYTHQSKAGEGEVENYEQNHVLRTFVTNLWGLPVEWDKTAGKKAMIRLLYNLPKNCNPRNCHVVAFVSYQGSRQIINSAEAPVVR